MCATVCCCQPVSNVCYTSPELCACSNNLPIALDATTAIAKAVNNLNVLRIVEGLIQ